jgi:predicted  nucleic acid-binding Zn-ribbon protein
VSDINALRALMEADRWIDRVGSQRTHLAEITELATVEDELRGLAKALQEAQTALTPVRSAYEVATKEAERLRKRANDLESTLSGSTANARELTALQRELEHVRELAERADDLELELLIAVEPLEDAIVAIKTRAQPAAQRRGVLREEIAQLQASLDDERAALLASRGQLAVAVAPELLARYDVAFARVGTSGAAQVDAGRCDGCRIALSPLDLDRWKVTAQDTFMNCPECGRLLLP